MRSDLGRFCQGLGMLPKLFTGWLWGSVRYATGMIYLLIFPVHFAYNPARERDLTGIHDRASAHRYLVVRRVEADGVLPPRVCPQADGVKHHVIGNPAQAGGWPCAVLT